MENTDEAKKYEPLRNALSHTGQLRADTIKELETNFGKGYFDLPYCIFDHSLPKNIEHLQIQVKDLRNIAMDNIRKELQKQKPAETRAP